MSVTIQCAVKSIRNQLNEIDRILKLICEFDIENDALNNKGVKE